MPLNARSWLVVIDIKSPEIILKIGEKRQPEATARIVGFEKRGVSAAPDKLKTCRRSVPAVVQFRRSKRRLSGLVQPPWPLPRLVRASPPGSLMQCDRVESPLTVIPRAARR